MPSTLLLAAVVLVPPLRAPADSPAMLIPQVRAVRAAQTVVVDGRLEESLWRTAQRIVGFRQRDPIENAEPTESTVVYVAYDEVAMYVAARLYDHAPDSIVARLGRRDNNTSSDRFTVFIDSYHDRRSGFYFGVDAAGTLYDGVLLNDDWDDDSWDGVWDGRVQRDSLGWTVEMRIPFSQLRFRPGEELTWGINFSRDIARKNERDFLVFTPKNASGFVSRFPDLVGLEAVKPPTRVELLPYALTKGEKSPAQPGDPFHTGSAMSGAAGLDAKLGLGGLVLNATVNPDFGQVEVDPAVVNLSDVETVYQEKRPFFVEGSSIFNFGQGGANDYWGFNWGDPEFFYSRRVGRAPQGASPDADYTDAPTATHILGAVKATGKIGGDWNLGAFSALTSREYASLDTAGVQWRAEVEPPASYNVFRLQKEFPEGRHALGVIATFSARQFTGDYLRDQIVSGATTGGIDGWTFLDRNKTWVLTGWVGGSDVRGSAERITSLQENSQHYLQRPDAKNLGVDSSATSLTGWAGRVYLNKQRGNWFSNSALGVISPKFDVNDLGLLWRANVINAHTGWGYQWTQPGKVFRNAMLMGAVFGSWNFDGDLTWTGIFNMGRAQLLNYWGFRYNLAYNPQTVNDRQTRGGPLMLNLPGYQINLEGYTDDRKTFVGDLSVGTYQAEQEHSVYVNPMLQIRPAPSLMVSVGPMITWYRTPVQYVDAYADPTATATYGMRYVFASLDQTELSGALRMNWTFTPKLSLQLYAQPLISAGDYSDYKALARPKSFAFNHWNDGSSSFDSTTYTPPQQDFNFKSLRGNAVLRWEYRPGSTMYFVWTQTRQTLTDNGSFEFGNSMHQLIQSPADNIFMVKVTYWLNP